MKGVKHDIKLQWAPILRYMLESYRKAKPKDLRSDFTILTEFMEFFVSEGFVKKTNGRFVVPRIDFDK